MGEWYSASSVVSMMNIGLSLPLIPDGEVGDGFRLAGPGDCRLPGPATAE
jgi:hypothetical protein